MYTQAEEEQCSRMGTAFPFQDQPAFHIPATEVPPMVVYGPKVTLNHIDLISICRTCGRENVCSSGYLNKAKCWCPKGTIWIEDEKPVNPAHSCKRCRKYQGYTPGNCNGVTVLIVLSRLTERCW